MKIHPKAGLLQGPANFLPELTRRIQRHLAECPDCRSRTASTPRQVLPWRPPVRAYDDVVQRALESLRPRFAAVRAEQSAAPLLLDELFACPPGRRQLLLLNSRRFQNTGLCRLLLRRSREATPADPRRGEELATLALQLADALDPQVLGWERIEDLRGQGWMLLANAWRVQSDLRRAEAGFRRAAAHLRSGTGDLLDRAELLRLQAGLCREQRRFTAANRLLRRSLSIWLALEEVPQVVRTLVSWSIVCRDQADPEAGAALLERAALLAGPDTEPRLRLAIRHNRALCLLDLGRLLEAQAILERHRDSYSSPVDPFLELRREWLRGEVARETGQAASAVDLLAAVRDGFLAQENDYEAGLASLDLALAQVLAGRRSEAAETAREALTVFCAFRVAREALAALILAQI